MRKLFVLLFLIVASLSLKAEEVRLDCHTPTALDIEFRIDRDFPKVNDMNAFNSRTRFATFINLEETSLRCFAGDVCYQGKDIHYTYHIRIPEYVFVRRASHSAVHIEARSRGFYRSESFYIGCDSWR